MGNIFYVAEYAQHLEQEQLRAKLEQRLSSCLSSDISTLDQLDDRELVQMVVALEHTMKALREKQNTIQSQQCKIEGQFERLYTSPALRNRILKNRPIEDLEGFSVRVYMLLRKSNITTLFDLCSKSREELFIIVRRNKRFLADVEKCLSDIGLELYGIGNAEDSDTAETSENSI